MLAHMHRAPQELRTYFVTFTCAERRRLFQVDASANLMLHVLQTQREKARMQVHAFIVMPDHVHALLTPAPDVSLEKAVQFLKGGFSFLLKSKLDVWERGYNETRVRDAEAFSSIRTYVEMNPVRKDLCSSPEQFRFSSAWPYAQIDPAPEWFFREAQG